MLYFTLASKAYARNLQYRGHTWYITWQVPSLVTCMLASGSASGPTTSLENTGCRDDQLHCIHASITLISGFLTNGLGIPLSVRTGQIALDLMRPVHLFTHLMAREWGQIAYQFVYKSLPIYLLYSIVFFLKWPSEVWTLGYAALALTGASYLSICMNYIIGVTSMWTTESSWLHWANHALMNLMAGFFIPLEWLPEWLEQLAWLSPYPFYSMYPPEFTLVLKTAPYCGEPCFGVCL